MKPKREADAGQLWSLHEVAVRVNELTRESYSGYGCMSSDQSPTTTEVIRIGKSHEGHYAPCTP
jgi:hypothetical protein